MKIEKTENQNLIKCSGCEHAKIVEDDEYCVHLKCMKTSKRGKDIAWHMKHCWCADGTKVDPYAYLEDRANHLAPWWCPFRKKQKEGSGDGSKKKGE